MSKPRTLRSLGEQYRQQAAALGEQIARHRKAFQTEQFTMNTFQKEQYYYNLSTLLKQKHDAEVVARTLVYYYEHDNGKKCDPDTPLTYTLEVTPCRRAAEQEAVDKAG